MKMLLSCVIVTLCLIAPPSSVCADDTVAAPADSIWFEDWDTAMAVARRDGKPVVVDFFSNGCGACRAMHENVFTDPGVRERLAASWVCISANTSRGLAKGTWDGKAMSYSRLAEHFRVVGVPTFVFIDSDGEPVQTVVGYKNAELFSDILDYMAERAYERNITFADFRRDRQ